MTLGENVKARRIRLGMTQEELATRMGYKSRSSINKIELGRNVSQKIISDLAHALNCSPAELLFDTGETIEILEAFDAVKCLQDAFEQTGYYKDRFTIEEIEDIMQYANFVMMKRTPK